MSETFTNYAGFVDKFKPKKTTDDCYTPPAVYDAVLAWVRAEFAIPESAPILRPFRPGGDYEAEDYPTGCYVVDNPPFSILSQIVRFYVSRGIHFFLFAPGLTVLTASKHCNAVACCADIVYANGAKVRTSFLTDLGDYRVRTAPGLRRIIEDIQRSGCPSLPAYELPNNLLTSARLERIAALGIDFRLRADACTIIGNIDAMRRAGKGLYGAAVLFGQSVGERLEEAIKAARSQSAERTKTRDMITWSLSAEEREAARRFDAKGGAEIRHMEPTK